MRSTMRRNGAQKKRNPKVNEEEKLSEMEENYSIEKQTNVLILISFLLLRLLSDFARIFLLRFYCERVRDFLSLRAIFFRVACLAEIVLYILE